MVENPLHFPSMSTHFHKIVAEPKKESKKTLRKKQEACNFKQDNTVSHCLSLPPDLILSNRSLFHLSLYDLLHQSLKSL
jgi:hypothetical protein